MTDGSSNNEVVVGYCFVLHDGDSYVGCVSVQHDDFYGTQHPTPHEAMLEAREIVAMLLHEARIAATLSHPNIVQIFDVGEVDDIYFIAMELVTGPDLRLVLRHCLQTTGPMPVGVTLTLVALVAFVVRLRLEVPPF